MKILQILPNLNIGGAEVLTVKMSILLKRMGCEVTFLTFVFVENYLTKLLEANNIHVVVVPKNRFYISRYYSLRNVFFVANYLKNNRFDIVHSHLTSTQICMACVRYFYRNKVISITTEHSTYNRRRKWFFKPVDYFLYSQFDRVIAISEATKTELVKWVPGVDNICEIIFNGVDLSEFIGEKTAAGMNDERCSLSVISVGRFEVQKAYDILIKAFALTEEMCLYLVGEGALKEEMMLLVKDLKIEDKVFFLGHRSDVASLLSSADIYVQSSLWEGFGIASVEAMASGLPIIASDVLGLGDVVGRYGMLFPAGDYKKLANLLMLLRSDNKLRKKMSDLARRRASDFSLSVTVEKYFSLYRKMLLKS